MAQQSRTTFENTFNDSGTGLFKNNTSGDIGADDVRTLVENLTDSYVNITDDILTSAQTHPGGSTTVLSSYRSIFYQRKDISSASVLTANATPVEIVAAPSAGYMIVPIAYHVCLDYNSAAYATNTTFRFEINGVAVSNTNTTILPGTADRYTIMHAIDVDTTTSLAGQSLVFEVQTGNPTTGNSAIYTGVFYKVVWAFGAEP